MPLDDNTLHALATKSIIDSLSDDMKAELLARAVKGLFQVDEATNANFYGNRDKRTKLEKIFDEALAARATVFVREMLLEPKHQEPIRVAIASALQRTFIDPEGLEKVTTLFQNALAKGLSERDR